MKNIEERIFEYHQPGKNGKDDETVRVTGKWISDNYYEPWRRRVIKKGGAHIHDYTKEDCILDFIATNWAYEIKEE